MRRFLAWAALAALAAAVTADPASAFGRRGRPTRAAVCPCPPPPPCYPVYPAPPAVPYLVYPPPGVPAAAVPAAAVPARQVPAGRIRVGDRTFAYRATTQTDRFPVDEDLADAAAAAAVADPRPKTWPGGPENFDGKSRWRAKTSFVGGPPEPFDSLANLLDTLPTDKQMLAKYNGKKGNPPRITTSTPRVEEELRQVRVKTFLLAANKQKDRDYHVIVGDAEHTGRCMNVEISGLPGPGAEFDAARAQLTAARNQFKELLGDGLPAGRQYVFYDPIPVTIDGSLFWDFEHPTPNQVGPEELRDRITSAWEIHPITRIEFGH